MQRLTRYLFVCFVIWLIHTLPAYAINLNLLENPGFEKKATSLWSAFDSCRLEITKINHSGKQALAFHPLKEGAGAAADVSSKIAPGYRYSFSGWFRNLEAGWGQLDILILFRQKDTAGQVLIGRVDCNKANWTSLANEFYLPEDAAAGSIRLVLKASWGQIAFVADDLELRPALQIKFVRSMPSSDPAILIHMGVQDKQRAGLKAAIDIYDQKDQILDQFTSPLDLPVIKALAPGFYRVSASITDLDKRKFDTERIGYYGRLETLTGNLEQQMNLILSSPDRVRYHGWLRYLNYRVTLYKQREGENGDQTLRELFRLNRWVQGIDADPDILNTLGGVQEWAYLSRVDESGQPFKLAIPVGYDSKRSYPLVVVMHGYGGNHLEYSGGVQSNPDYFELHVLGRARGGGYVNLSEMDVLDAVAYVQENWNIDNKRIHITGASMGGGGTFKLATRYPDKWASGRPVCGYGSDLPILNALHVPLYSTHSQDDPTVPVLGSRAPLQKLIGAGAQVVIDETNGLQHAAWNYAEGNNRALQWMYDQVLPEFREIKEVEYTAIDRLACGAYWLKVAEWGEYPGPARFKATAGRQNQLYLKLENIKSLMLDLSNSPFDQKQDLKISIDGAVPIKVSAPLADSVFITNEGGIWSAGWKKPGQTGVVLRTSGGVHNLYRNEPLLIVYGTCGDSTTRNLLAQAALAAGKSPGPMWVGDQGEIKDGVPNFQLLYGRLKIKPDTAVNAADLNKYNLVLIGTAAENSIVKQMQTQLPVQFDKDIICSDGMRIPGADNIMGLYYYNPLATDRLIFWVAADNPAAYHPYNLLLQLEDGNPCGSDLLVVRDNPPEIIKVRSFDSRWNWSNVYSGTAGIPADENTFGDVFRRMAEAMRKTSGSDYAMQLIQVPPELQAGIPGLTQWYDIAALDPLTPLAVVQLKGSQLLKFQQGITQQGISLRLYPAIDQSLKPERIYQLVLPASYSDIQLLINLQQNVPDSFKILDISLFEAMKQILF